MIIKTMLGVWYLITINIWIIIEEEILEQDPKKIILEEEVFLQTLAALMVLIIMEI